MCTNVSTLPTVAEMHANLVGKSAKQEATEQATEQAADAKFWAAYYRMTNA